VKFVEDVGENDDESEGEWEDGAQDLIANDNEIESSARDLESKRRFDEFMATKVCELILGPFLNCKKFVHHS